MELYLPYYTDDTRLENKQVFLNQVFLPQLSNDKTELHKFFKGSTAAAKEEQRRNKELSEKFISLHPQHGCDFESFMRTSKTKNRKKHIDFMENIKPSELAGLMPYARFFLIPEGVSSVDDIKRTAIPIAFDKAFDLEQLLSTANSTSRGEGAGLLSISVNRQYDITGDFDPISFAAKFFFSSYDVFINKPAVERGEVFGFSYNSNLSSVGARTGFFNSINGANITYKELIRRPRGKERALFTLLLEYGWTYSKSLSDDILSRSQKEIIDNFEKTYYKLTPKEHKINFNPDGSFNLDVDYIPTFLENVDRATDFKANIYSFSDKSCECLRDVNANFSAINESKKRIKELLKQNENKNTKKEQIQKNNKDIKKIRKELSEQQVKYSNLFAQQFVALAKCKKLLNTFNLFGNSSIEDEKFKMKLEVENPKLGKKTFTKTYTSKGLLQAIKQSLPKDRKKDFFKNSLTGNNATEDTIVFDILSDMIPSEDDGGLVGNFMFVKDIFKLVYYIAGDNQSLPTNSEKVPYPYHIFGNIAAPSTSGKKYWCNIGDLPIEIGTLKGHMRNYIKVHPNGTPRQFIVYFLHKIVPNVFVNKKQRAFFPSIATPFFHFNAAKFKISELAGGFKKRLFQGAEPEKTLSKFSEEFFNDADPASSTGCFFIGQTSSLFYENSKLFMSDKIRAFQTNFFKDDKKLKEIGIGKLLVGSSKGLVKNISFSSNSDDAITNLSYALSGLKIGVPDDLITTNFQYTVSAELFGNRIFDFSNLIYIPSWTFGRSANLPTLADGATPTATQLTQLREAAKSNDFEIGGLYTVNSITDNLQLNRGAYTKTLNASCILRDSTISAQKLKSFDKDNKGILTPLKNESATMADYIINNIKLIQIRVKNDVAEMVEWAAKNKFGVPKGLDGKPLIKPLSLKSEDSLLAGGLAKKDPEFNKLSEENEIRLQELEVLTDQRFQLPSSVGDALNTEVPKK